MLIVINWCILYMISGRYIQSFRLNSHGAFADHSLMVLTTLFL